MSAEVVSEIWKKCDLARAYLFPNTFYWLASFDSFKNFIDERKLNRFVESDYTIEKWDNESNGFTSNYYEELINRLDN